MELDITGDRRIPESVSTEGVGIIPPEPVGTESVGPVSGKSSRALGEQSPSSVRWYVVNLSEKVLGLNKYPETESHWAD